MLHCALRCRGKGPSPERGERGSFGIPCPSLRGTQPAPGLLWRAARLRAPCSGRGRGWSDRERGPGPSGVAPWKTWPRESRREGSCPLTPALFLLPSTLLPTPGAHGRVPGSLWSPIAGRGSSQPSSPAGHVAVAATAGGRSLCLALTNIPFAHWLLFGQTRHPSSRAEGAAESAARVSSACLVPRQREAKPRLVSVLTSSKISPPALKWDKSSSAHIPCHSPRSLCSRRKGFKARVSMPWQQTQGRCTQPRASRG